MEGLRVDTPPRISRAGFVAVLEEHHSPAAVFGGECYDVVAAYGLDPAVALAFFEHESTFGTKGVAVRSRNWGNLRTAPVDPLFADSVHDGWTWFVQRADELPGQEWVRSCRAWARLISKVYIGGKGLYDVTSILRVYAPSEDGNAPAAYARAVEKAVAEWEKMYPTGQPIPTLENRLLSLEKRLDVIEARCCPNTVTISTPGLVWCAAEAVGPAETAGSEKPTAEVAE